ncbi:MAG: UvrD-helicase domain-containing protein [Proteobacteria bacterium]|nr:UvrD-helicase domain-containing protein [Pseudomonadota bacterium]
MLEQVKASAGSGKTYALTARFLELLLGSSADTLPAVCGQATAEGYGWPEILAVTFTNKAAAEMKERVIGSLKDRALGKIDGPAAGCPPETAALWLERILKHYHQLNIRTIDSLLTLIMRIFALEVGVAPDFEMVFDPAELFDEAFDRVAGRAETQDGEERELLETALSTMLRLENRPGFMPGSGFRTRLLELLRFRLTDRSAYVTDPVRLHQAITPLREDFLRAAKAMPLVLDGLNVKKHFLNFLDKCLAHGEFDPVPTSTMIEKGSFVECVNKASQGAVGTSQEQAYAELQQTHETYQRGRRLLESARNWSGFIRLADLVTADLARVMRERNVLLSAVCPGIACDLLGGEFGVPDAFCRMGARLRFMLVDEFQDTSRDQWGAMSPLAEECLSKGGGAFLVGDVKQAIYGWRGGDARLFDEVMTQPSLTAMTEVHSSTLPRNWRSRPEIIQFNNALFAPLGDEDTAFAVAEAMLGEAPEAAMLELAEAIASAFAGATQQVPAKAYETPGYVRLTRVEAETKDELQEAVRLEMQALFEDLSNRRRAADMAVLVRSNSEAALVAGWLIDWGVPVITENSLRLAEHPLVRQLTALLRFLDYPLDDLALWEFLSGEEIFLGRAGLAKNILTDWLAGRERGSLYPQFQKDFPEAAARFVSRYVKKAGFMTPYDVVTEAVADFRLLERHPRDAAFVRRFMEVVHAAEQAGRQSIAAFLEYWDLSGGEEKVPLPETVDAVRVMTMHQSKGLEFPVVIVPFHHWRFSAGEAPVPFEFQGMQLLAPPCREMGHTYWELASRTLLEQLNLLYVAWTRPEEELYALLTGSSRTKSRPFVKALGILLEDRLFEQRGANSVHEHGQRPDSASPATPTLAPDQAPYDAETLATPFEDEPEAPMSWLPRLKIHRHFALGASLDTLLGGGPVFDARVRGTLIHDALDRLGSPGISDTHLAARAAISAHADLLPPGDEAREAIAAEVQGILDWAVELPEFQGWVQRGLPECPILDAEGNEHRPDLLVLDPEETIVVEYKTGSPDPAHKDQVRRYMALLAAMDRVAPAMRAVIVYLDQRTLTEVQP